MSKKFGKFLLAAAALGTAAACAYHYLQKEVPVFVAPKGNDDADDPSASAADSAEPHYVPLTPQSTPAAEDAEEEQDLFTETDSSLDADIQRSAEEIVEEFFNDNN